MENNPGLGVAGNGLCSSQSCPSVCAIWDFALPSPTDNWVLERETGSPRTHNVKRSLVVQHEDKRLLSPEVLLALHHYLEAKDVFEWQDCHAKKPGKGEEM